MKFENRKKLAMIMTLASVLSSKTSGINKSKSSQNLETVGEKVIGDLKSSGNFSKSGINKNKSSQNLETVGKKVIGDLKSSGNFSKLGIDKNKSSQNLETVGEKVIGDLKSSGNFSKLGIEKTVLSNNENIINNKSLDNNSKRLSERAVYGILAASGAGTAALGALVYHVSGLLFGNRNTENPMVDPIVDEFARSIEFFIKYFKKVGITKISISNSGAISFWKADARQLLDCVDVAKLESPDINDKKLIYASLAIDEYWNMFLYSYQSYLANKLSEIAFKHGLSLTMTDNSIRALVKNYDKCNIDITTERKDKKLLVHIFADNYDITQEYNKDNPETDLDKRKKGFYDELVKFINNDDFIKKLFLE